MWKPGEIPMISRFDALRLVVLLESEILFLEPVFNAVQE